MAEKMVLVEAFNEGARNFLTNKGHLDIQAILQMTTFEKTNPSKINCQIGITPDRFSMEMSHDNFLAIMGQQNISEALKKAFLAAEQDEKAGISGVPRVVAGTNQWQVSVICPKV